MTSSNAVTGVGASAGSGGDYQKGASANITKKASLGATGAVKKSHQFTRTVTKLEE